MSRKLTLYILVMILFSVSVKTNATHAASSLVWEFKASIPTAKYDAGGVTGSDGNIYIAGGDNYTNMPLSQVEQYNTGTNTWITKTSMPVGRWRFGIAATSNGKLYVIGGENCGGDSCFIGSLRYTGEVLEYSINSDTWITKTSIPTPRMELAVTTASNGKIYAIGGHNTGGNLATVEEYDPVANSWSPKTAMPRAFNSATAISTGNGKIYVFDTSNTSQETVLEYNISSDTWTQKTIVPTARKNFAVTLLGSKIYVAGGEMTSGYVSAVEVYNYVTNSWSTETSLSKARLRLNLLSGSDGKLYAIGGWGTISSGNGALNTVEATPIGKIPVILLPGMLASTNWDCFFTEQNCSDANKWGWTFGNAAGQYYQPMIDAFAAAGYTKENGYFRVFYYDWRKPLSFNATFLQATIADVLATTGASEVNLVGHSMGGLVARSYIQSSYYHNDVANLITIGTPHEGSAMSYSPWEGAAFYRIDEIQKDAYSLLLLNYAWRDRNLNMVQVIQGHILGLKDTLITTDYLSDSANQDQVIHEANMKHRNAQLHILNSDLSTLFARVSVFTVYGEGIETPYHFYVQNASPKEGGKWDDGTPVWTRENEFVTPPLGDDTVIAQSAQLPNPAYRIGVSGVRHNALPQSDEVISASLTALGIPFPTGVAKPAVSVTQTSDTLLIFTLSGSMEMTATDSLGNQIGPGSSTINGGEYISAPDNLFKFVVIPDPSEGIFTITVQGQTAGEYELGLLNPGPPPAVITDITTLWDTSHSIGTANAPITYVVSYTLATSNTTALFAETPVIQMPIWITTTEVSGKGTPGHIVEIRDAETNDSLGTGSVDLQGNFRITLTMSLRLDKLIYPWSNGVRGVAVPIQPISLYLPLLLR